MKVSGPVRAVLGFAVSGGFALVLSGSALAADSTLADNSNQTTTQTENFKVTNTDVKTDDSSAVKVSVDSKDASGQAPAATATETSKPDAIIPETTTSKPEGATSGTAVAGVKAPATAVLVSPMLADTTSLRTPAAAVVAPAPDVAPATTKSEPEILVIGSTVLPIQPKITTSHPVAVVDLASLIPTAPVQRTGSDTIPAPSQPSGVLGRLTAGLAGVVVPVIFHVPSAIPVGSSSELGLIALIWLSLGLTALTFGAWLRRGGYAHAARSDVADAAHIFTFATPLKLSYGLVYDHTTAHF